MTHHENPCNKCCTVALRALEPEDVDMLYLWENSPEMWKFGHVRAPYSRAQLWTYVQEYTANPLAEGQLRLVVELACDGGKAVPIGLADLYNLDMRNCHASVGIMIVPEHRNLGYGCRALELLGEYAAQVLGMHQLFAVISTANEPSLLTFAAAGYEKVATLPHWLRTGADFTDATLVRCVLTN